MRVLISGHLKHMGPQLAESLTNTNTEKTVRGRAGDRRDTEKVELRTREGRGRRAVVGEVVRSDTGGTWRETGEVEVAGLAGGLGRVTRTT